jgi:transposase
MIDKTTRLGLIKRMRDKEIKWDDIAYILDAKSGVLRQEWSTYQKIRDLPPKVVITKRKTDGAMGIKIKKIRLENPRLSFRDFGPELEKAGFAKNQIPSKTRIVEYLKRNGYILRRLIKKTGINSANIKKRVDWCTLMSEKPKEFWDRVIWSDETTVRQAPKGKDVFVHVHQSTKSEDLQVNSQLHSGGFSVMFWGCFSKMGLGPLVVLDGSMTAEKYIGLLEDVLLPELEAAGGPMVFMQDNAPCHKAKVVMDFFNNHQVDVMEWPAQSPDMNPIENLWAIIKARRQKKYGYPKTKNDLIDQIFDIWDSIDQELVGKLADSANKRVSEVLRLNGKVSTH